MARLRLTDALPAAALLLLGLAEIGVGARGDARVEVAAIVTVGMVSLLWRRVRPVLVGLIVAGCLAAASVVAFHIDILAVLLAVLLASYTLGHQRGPRVAALGAAGMLALVWSAVLTSPEPGAGSLLFTAIAVLVPAFAGQALRSAGVQAERERAEEAKRAVEEEQARIARELHDIVAHGVSLMVLHAGAAQRLVESDPSRGREALELIEQTGRQSLEELQRLLGVLRPGSSGRAVEPQPGLADVATLVDQVRATGTDVRLETLGLDRAVPPGLGLTAYRIVQEALTNATRHAPQSSVRVAVDVRDHEIQVQVDDSGSSVHGRTPGGGGHGLVGMRERTRMYGGEFHAGPVADGWRVNVRLPMPTS